MIPPALGYLRVVGQQSNLYDTGMGTALLVVVLVVLFTGLIWQTAVSLDETDRARAAVAGERDDLLLRERAARETAERANRLKDEFIATVSHELRTPLNAIVGWTQLLRTNFVSDERRSYAADVVARNGKFLARLIEDLLDVSRIATGQITLDLQPVNLASVARRAIDAFAATAGEKSVSLIPRVDGVEAIVSGDAERLQQVVNNLLSNAVKFTPSGGKVDVQRRATPDGVELVVTDTGRGIDPTSCRMCSSVSARRTRPPTREHGGLGLGLAIARELVELHRGSLSALLRGTGPGRDLRRRAARDRTVAPSLPVPDAADPPEQREPTSMSERRACEVYNPAGDPGRDGAAVDRLERMTGGRSERREIGHDASIASPRFRFLCVIVVALAAAGGARQRRSGQPRARHGVAPTCKGTWTGSTLTPLERPSRVCRQAGAHSRGGGRPRGARPRPQCARAAGRRRRSRHL